MIRYVYVVLSATFVASLMAAIGVRHRVVERPTTMESPAVCDGCSKNTLTGSSPLITIVQELGLGNGQCDDPAEPGGDCVATACPISQSTVIITNASGGTLWWTSKWDPLEPRTELLAGGRLSFTVPGGGLGCGAKLERVFWDSSSDSTGVVANWGFQCTKCPDLN